MIYLTIITIILIVVTIIYMFPIALVQGNSMLPTLEHNQVLLMRRVIDNKDIKIGEVYAYKKDSSDERIVIKRLTLLEKDSLNKYSCYFTGDNQADSYDSRDYGYVKAENIIAVLAWNTKYQLKQKGEK